MWVVVAGESLGWPTLLGIGSGSAAMVAAGALLGWWLDGLFGTSPILIVLGLALGLVGGFCYTALRIRPFLKD